MKMDRFQIDIRLGIILVMTLSILGCNNQDINEPTPQLMVEKTNQPTASNTPTVTSSPTFTITPTFTSTPIPTIITPTSLPTISSNLLDQEISKLVHTNGGCSLPCYWGITPGENSWLEAKQLLNQYNAEITLSSTDEVWIENKHHMVEYYKVVLFSSDFPNGKHAYFDVIDKYHLYTIQSYHSSTDPYFLLSYVLLSNGKPNSVYIQTYSGVPGYDYPFYVILFYKEQNFAAGYHLWAKKQGENIVWCPYSNPPTLWTWSENVSAFVEPDHMMGLMVGQSLPHFKPIEEVTDYSVESFFQEFQYPSRERCIKTHMSHWE